MIDLFSVRQVRLAEQRAIYSGESVLTLMDKAGRGVFEQVSTLDYPSVVIFAGSGNNGGDGYALAYYLKKNDKNVFVVCVDEPKTAAALKYRRLFEDEGGRVLSLSENFSLDKCLIVDCIFGVGFRDSVEFNAKKAVELINDSKNHTNFVVSVDVPSGVNGDNGLAQTAVNADLTLTIGCYKVGLFLNDAVDHTGIVKVVDIGLRAEEPTAILLEEGDFNSVLQIRRPSSYKNQYGVVGVFGGSKRYSGAVKLAAMAQAAVYSGCGISRLICPDNLSSSVTPYILESTLYPVASDGESAVFDQKSLSGAIKGLNALSVGMGLGDGQDIGSIVKYLLSFEDLKLCIDADGLNALSKDMTVLSEKKTRSVVLTPHLGEFSRLTKLDKNSIVSDPIAVCKRFATQYGVTLLLKGGSTIVTDGETAYIVKRGTPGMATAGSGDVLSGVIAGLLGYNGVSPLTVSCAAFVCGVSAEIGSENIADIAYSAGDTVANLKAAVTKVYKASHNKQSIKGE
ncbi:MAG: NAD(P)H-hydrate dehydratase [Clostridia bacterium]|nr:NAD(P)H-hydrate dehydratase [Clostridia bacterium]